MIDLRHATLLALLAACSPGPRPPQPVVPVLEAQSETACQDSACWLARAESAQQLGLVDVAAAHHGRVYEADHEAKSLTRWIDALLASGQHRRARLVLAELRADTTDPALLAAIAAELARVPAAGPVRPLAPEPASPAVMQAHATAFAGDIPAATDAFAAALVDAGPARLAAAADALGSATDPAAQDWARRTRARARVLFHEQEAALRLVPIETWMVRDVAWREGQRISLRNVEALDVAGARLGLIETAMPGSDRPTRRLFFREPVEAMQLTSDSVIRSDGPRLVEQHLLTGDMRTLASPGARIDLLTSVGSGASLRTLVGERTGARLFAASGDLLGTYTLGGMTPTIIRRYTGEGTYHENILRDETSWPVALAMTHDAGILAIGASDSHVHVFDHAAGSTKLLQFAWTYEERRRMGGNPDLNLPLALHLEPDGAQLLAMYAHGDVIRWDIGTGQPLRHIAATCSEAELAAVVNRYQEPGSPPLPPSDSDRESCGRATVAAISDDGTMVATGGISGVRVRDTSTGAGLALMLEQGLPDGRLAFMPDHTLVMSDLFGAVALWRRGQALTRPVPPSPSGPVSPLVSDDGILQFALDRRIVAWDLGTRKPIAITLAAKEYALALAPDGKRVAVQAGGFVELRTLQSQAPPVRLPLPADARPEVQFTASGHVLVDMQGATRSLTLVDPRGAVTPLKISTAAHSIVLSDDGRWLAGVGHDIPLQVWSTQTGQSQHSLDPSVRHLAFAHDGSFVVWMIVPQPDVPKVQVKLQRIGAKEPGPTLELDGWPNSITVAPDGAEVLILLESGNLIRWRHAAGTHTRHQEVALAGATSLRLADDGRTLLLPGYGKIQIRANDATLTPLATVYALLSGGWLTISRDGAIDGSADAVEHLVTEISRGDETLLFTGGLGWDAAHVTGVATRALAGEQVAPPVR